MAETPTPCVCHGGTKLPALKLPDGTVITHSRAILSWVRENSGESAATQT